MTKKTKTRVVCDKGCGRLFNITQKTKTIAPMTVWKYSQCPYCGKIYGGVVIDYELSALIAHRDMLLKQGKSPADPEMVNLHKEIKSRAEHLYVQYAPEENFLDDNKSNN